VQSEHGQLLQSRLIGGKLTTLATKNETVTVVPVLNNIEAPLDLTAHLLIMEAVARFQRKINYLSSKRITQCKIKQKVG